MTNYLIYNPQKRKPQKVHHNWHEAREEAERLARKELCNIYILKIDSVIRPRQSVGIDVDIVPRDIKKLT